MIKLFSLNIERAKHYDRWIPFAKKGDFDVICLQEVYQSDVKIFESKLGMHFHFAPMCNLLHDNRESTEVVGVAVAIRGESSNIKTQYYFQKYNPEEPIREPSGFRVCPRVLLSISCAKDGDIFNIATTHFTWTHNGEITDQQEEDAENLISLLKEKNDFILCGDMNAPRGKECFSMFADQYIDHIPQRYESSLDPVIYKKHTKKLMVDALFSTPHYRAKNVELVSGLSDHMGIVVDIYKK